MKTKINTKDETEPEIRNIRNWDSGSQRYFKRILLRVANLTLSGYGSAYNILL